MKHAKKTASKAKAEELYGPTFMEDRVSGLAYGLVGYANYWLEQNANVESAMAMLDYFYAFGPQIQRLKTECGCVSAIAGIFKAPFDIIADKLRGYVGLTMDMHTQPDKVLKACEALAPHLCHVGLTTADAGKQVPIGFWMHRGCVPFINPKQFESIYWPTLKPIIEEFWKQGHQTLFYAEGKWKHHLDTFRELSPGSIVFHCDQDDIFLVHQKLHDRFAILENGNLDPTVTGIGDYLRLDNAAGASVTADLNKLLLKAGFDYVSYRSLGGSQGQPDADNAVFSLSGGYQFKPGMLAAL